MPLKLATLQKTSMRTEISCRRKGEKSPGRFNRATDNQFAALRAKLRHFSEQRSARTKSLATSFAQTSKLDHVPSWQENRDMAETEIKRMRAPGLCRFSLVGLVGFVGLV